jgi:hypothetical protein
MHLTKCKYPERHCWSVDSADTLFFVTAGTASLCCSRSSPAISAVSGRGSQLPAGGRGKSRGKTQLVELAELTPGAFFGEGCVSLAPLRGIRPVLQPTTCPSV